MKVSGFWVMFFVVCTALVFFTFSDNCITGSKKHDMTYFGGGSTVTAISRKLKENSYTTNMKEKKRSSGTVNLEDYQPIDPVPSSKASVKPGPIEHGAPLIPYVPKPLPPDHPRRDGSG